MHWGPGPRAWPRPRPEGPKPSEARRQIYRYKIFDRLRDGAEQKGQYTGAINAEFRSGQLAGQFVDKKEISHTTLEGMSREKLEQRLKELENKISDSKNIIDITPEKVE